LPGSVCRDFERVHHSKWAAHDLTA
jgi:hypothetical protein